MESSTTQDTQSNGRQTLLSLLGGIVIWFAHQNITYGLASLTCKWGWFHFNLGQITGLQLLETLITLAALVGMAFMILLPYRNWRRFQSEKPLENEHVLEDTEKGRRPMAAFIPMALNCFLFLFVITNFVPIFALKACGQS